MSELLQIATSTAKRLFPGTAAVLSLLLVAHPSSGARKNGFVLDDALIPIRQILSGGPPRDGIPSIEQPRFVAAAEAGVRGTDRILGIERDGVAKAYPIAILNYHEIVNDSFGDEPIVVTYCPLCGTGMAFLAAIAGERRMFGVSGLLYNSDVLLYDRNSETLWSQLMLKAVAGPLKGTALEMVTVSHTTWGDWRRRHPETRVLAEDTGFRRNYRDDPYPGYASSRRVIFPVSGRDRRYHPKERVVGLLVNGEAKAYPFIELDRAGGVVVDVLGEQSVTVEFDAEHQTGRAVDEQGEELPIVIAYWFAWHAFYPKAEVFAAR